MKQTKKFIAFQDKENGHFVSEYKHNENRLAYKAGLCNSMQDALTLDYDAYERQKEQVDTLAEAFGCHSDAPEPEEHNSQSGFLDLLEALSK